MNGSADRFASALYDVIREATAEAVGPLEVAVDSIQDHIANIKDHVEIIQGRAQESLERVRSTPRPPSPQ